MKGKILSILKTAALIILFLAVFFFTFVISVVNQIDDQSIAALLGSRLWNIVYAVLPICAFIATIVLICIKKPFGLVIIPFFTYLVIIIGIFASSRLYFSEFSSYKWQKYPLARHLMLEDLAEEHMLIGMQRSEVLDLLGEGMVKGSGNWTCYSTGRWFLDPEVLQITFENDMAVDAFFEAEKAGKTPLYDAG